MTFQHNLTPGDTISNAGQEYNLRKNRKSAFWQDRYHATAVESNRHLRQCIAYIDMNMVRAGVSIIRRSGNVADIIKSRIPEKEKELLILAV